MHLYEQHCLTENKPQLLDEKQTSQYQKETPDWDIMAERVKNKELKSIICSFKLKDYHQTLLFINTIASLIHEENHHPDINFGYNHCSIYFTTHSTGGITLFDFICAAHIDIIYVQQGFSE